MIKKMMTLLVVVFMCTALFMLTSCAKRQIGMDQPVTPGETASSEMGKGSGDQGADRQGQGGPGTGDRDTMGGDKARLESEIRAFQSENIYFDYDRAELKSEARAILTKKAEWLRKNPGFSVRIEGHCDERGTNEYNLALGERRAEAAWKFMNALGISGRRLTTVSYGEEKPAAMGHNESAWSKNRRDEFKLVK